MTIAFISAGPSRSFPDGAPEMIGEGLIVAGSGAGGALGSLGRTGEAAFVAVELGAECLAEHIGLDDDPAYRRTLGFARFRMGDAPPGPLVELVRQPWTDPAAIDAARAAFESAGFLVALCNDMPGRIVNRLIRPYLNAVLRRFDDGLATRADLDMTLRLGLGYPEGPLDLLERTGLADHFDVSQALYDALGDPDFAPARRARVARARSPR